MNGNVNWIDLDRSGYIKSSLLKAKAHAARPAKRSTHNSL
jgi:hypothetical protein